jgi:hypothetical protein
VSPLGGRVGEKGGTIFPERGFLQSKTCFFLKTAMNGRSNPDDENCVRRNESRQWAAGPGGQFFGRAPSPEYKNPYNPEARNFA